MRRVLLVFFLILAAGLDAHSSYGAARRGGSPVHITPLPAPVGSLSRHGNGELFFEIDDAAPPARDRAARPRRVRVYWDQSASRADDDLAAERDLLLRYLDAVGPGIIDLVLLSGGASEILIIEAPHEEAELEQLLGELRYEGGTTAHDWTDLPLPPADACLYFSDGAVSVDPADAQRIRCPLFAVSSAPDANRGLLRVLARRSAGAYVDLSAVSLDEAVAGMTGGQPRVLGVTTTDGRTMPFALLSSGPEHFRIVGPVPSSGEIVVTLAGGRKATLTRRYSVKGVRVRQHDEFGVLWAMDHLYELCAAREPDTQRIAALARQYSVETAAVAADRPQR